MKVFVAVLFLFTTILNATKAQGDEKNYYSRRYDSIDVNTIFRSSRLLNNYVDCLLDKKPCPPEGKDLKRVLPEALRTRCSQCTKIQKEKALDVITRLYYGHSDIYLSLAERYDPTGEYTKNFEAWFDEQNAVKPLPPIPQENFSSRIPSTWITSSTSTTTTTQRTTTTRSRLRTSPTPRTTNAAPGIRTSTTQQSPQPTATTRRVTDTPIPVTTSVIFETVRTDPPIVRRPDPPTTRRADPTTRRPDPTTRRPDPTTRRPDPPIIRRPDAPIIPEVQPPPSVVRPEVFQRPFEPNLPSSSPPNPPVTFRQPPAITQRVEPPQSFNTPPLVVRFPQATNPPPPRESTVIFQVPSVIRNQQGSNRTPQINPQSTSLIDNFFVPNRNGPFRRSINRLIDTSERVVNNVAGMIRSTIDVIRLRRAY